MQAHFCLIHEQFFLLSRFLDFVRKYEKIEIFLLPQFQPEEIKVEDPDDDSPIEVCLFSDEEERQSSSGDEKNYLNYANNQGRDSFPESQPSEKVRYVIQSIMMT